MTEKQTIENASLDDIQAGDEVLWEHTETFHGVTRTVRREGIAHDHDQLGDWRTGDDGLITDGEGEGITITIHRHELPKNPAPVIIPSDGRYILATVGGVVYRAREAVLVGPGIWAGAWRSDHDVLEQVKSAQVHAYSWEMDRAV